MAGDNNNHNKKQQQHRGGDSLAELERLMRGQVAGQKEEAISMALQVDRIHDAMVELCRAVARTRTINIASRFALSPKEFFFQTFEADFLAYFEPLLRLDEPATTENAPSVILAKLEDFFWCSLFLLQQIDSDSSSQCYRLVSKLRRLPSKGETTLASLYLKDYFGKILNPVVSSNMLVFSETFQNFVLPPCLEIGGAKNDETQAAALSASAMQRFISEKELEALAELFGVEGIAYLIEEHLYKEAILPELRKLKVTEHSHHRWWAGGVTPLLKVYHFEDKKLNFF